MEIIQILYFVEVYIVNKLSAIAIWPIHVMICFQHVKTAPWLMAIGIESMDLKFHQTAASTGNLLELLRHLWQNGP